MIRIRKFREYGQNYIQTKQTIQCVYQLLLTTRACITIEQSSPARCRLAVFRLRLRLHLGLRLASRFLLRLDGRPYCQRWRLQ